MSKPFIISSCKFFLKLFQIVLCGVFFVFFKSTSEDKRYFSLSIFMSLTRLLKVVLVQADVYGIVEKMYKKINISIAF